MLQHQLPYFVILFNPRTGSNFCKSCLARHPDVHEVIGEERTSPMIRRGVTFDEMWPPTDQFIGKKLSLKFFVWAQVPSLVGDFPTIVLYRNNKLSQAISFALAEREKKWMAMIRQRKNGLVSENYKRDGIGHYSTEPLTLSVKIALDRIRKWQDFEAIARRRYPNALWIEYGELVCGDGLDRIQEFLGLKVLDLPRFRVKQSKGVNLDYVANVDEVLNSELIGWI